MKADMHEKALLTYRLIKAGDIACTGCGKSLRKRLQHQCHPRIYVHPSGDRYCTKTCMVRHLTEGVVMISKYCPIRIEVGAAFTIDALEREISEPSEGFEKFSLMR